MQEVPSHNSLWFLISRSLSNEASFEEEQILHEILQQDPSLQQQFDLLTRMWHAGNHFEIKNDEEEKENISHILQLALTEEKSTNKREDDQKLVSSRFNGFTKKFLIAISSAAVVIITASIIWLNSRNNNHVPAISNKETKLPTQTLESQNGSKTRTILPDGSTVWLNAGSRITYDNNFSGKTREVKLEGEAFFDVRKDAKHPFIVHVANYDIRVLGTEFNVKSYPEDKTVETTLLRGLVQVTKHGVEKQKPIFLHPNQKLIVTKLAADNESALPYKQTDEPEKKYTITPLDSTIEDTERIETAWVYNRLEFKDDNFEELANKLERWYNVTIVFDDDAVKKINLHGSFENETIEQALAALKIATPFNYSINGNEIHISSLTKNK